MRNRKADAKKGSWDSLDMEKAIQDVMKNNMSERKAAEMYSVKRSTLKRKLKEARLNGTDAVSYKPHSVSSMKIFSVEGEHQLARYCLSASKMGYGLSTVKLRSLAYEYAAKLGKRMPHSRTVGCDQNNSWDAHEKAGKDWLTAFMKRHPDLTVRKPEPTSIGRMSAFNRHNVEQFYSNVRHVLYERKLEPHQLWNCDETEVTTVQVPERVIAGRGEKQVAAVTSAERGTLVTMCNAVNACGTSIPPFYIFPRVHFKEVFLRNSIPGVSGTAYQTGWMVESTFIEWFKHFMKHVKPSTDRPVMLLLDNHETHLSLQFIDMAKENGVTVVTIPPHTSRKLQPLDVSVYGPFKRSYNRELDSWLATNGGKTVSIYELAELSGKAWSKAATSANIISGFASAGIHPFQPDKWTDDDFCLAQVTDRPNPQSCEDVTGISVPTEPSDVAGGSVLDVAVPDEAPSTIAADTHAQDTSASAVAVAAIDAEPPVADVTTAVTPRADRSEDCAGKLTPEAICPLPKAPPRKRINATARKKLNSEILIRKEQSERKEKNASKRKLNVQQKDSNDEKRKGKSAVNNTKGKGLKRKKDISDDSDSDTEPEYYCIVCMEPFSNSKSREKWVKCISCSNWAHAACTDDEKRYFCHHCESD